MIRRILRQVHLWIGIALCLPLVMLGLTGSILVFEDELNAAFTVRQQVTVGEAQPVGAIIAAARAAAPAGFVPQSYVAPASDGLATVRLTPPRRNAGVAPGPVGPVPDALRVEVDPVSLATYPDPPDGFLRRLALLHTTLLLKNREGRQLVGWLGVAMLIMAASGLVNWLPRWTQWRNGQWRNGQWRRAFAVDRRARGVRLLREAHGMAGIWGLLVFVVVSFGGVELAFPDAVRGIVNLALPARDLRTAAAAIKVEPQRGIEPMSVDDALALARLQVPDGELRFVFLPARPDQPIRVALQRRGEERREPPVTVFVDPWSRRIAQTLDPQQYSAGERLLAWQHPMHAGQGLGPVWKFLVFLCGLLPLGFAVSGVAMWWLRRRRRAAGHTAPDTIVEPVYTARRAGE